MVHRAAGFRTETELQEAILQEKARGVPDLEIGQRFGVTFRYIERLITKSQGVNVSALRSSKRIGTLYPNNFKEEQTTVWSFKRRGDWATHSGEYRGNWSPYIPRNVILKYSQLGDLVLDYFCGAGTTAVECKLLGRRCIALDINDKAVELAREKVDFDVALQRSTFADDRVPLEVYEPEVLVGDARHLSLFADDSVDLICAHPPYSNIIHYTDSKEGDLSFLDVDDYLSAMGKVARESFRVLRPGGQCAILIGDMRKQKHVIPLGFRLINVYLDAGFKLRELVIKRQHNCKTTGFWYANSIKYNFLLLAHEYLPIFQKPEPPSPSTTRQPVAEYTSVTPARTRPSLKRKLDGLETTAVWVLPRKDFERRLNKNVIDRYSGEGGYSTVTFASRPDKNRTYITEDKPESEQGLLFIKSPFLTDSPSGSDIESYLRQTNEIVGQELSRITAGGFIVIQTQDVRINGYVEPLAKKLVDVLPPGHLWLKEIVVVTQEKQNSEIQTESEYFKISHQYLLVYEVTR